MQLERGSRRGTVHRPLFSEAAAARRCPIKQ
jgi:hypothetical protein